MKTIAHFTFNEKYDVTVFEDLLLIKDRDELIYKGPPDDLNLAGIISIIKDYRRQSCTSVKTARGR